MFSLKVYILPYLPHPDLILPSSDIEFFSTRRLTGQEVQYIHDSCLKRYYLKTLELIQEQQFFSAFDLFWGKVINAKEPSHPFWRNVVSSKMQEWESSCGYLALCMFAIAKDSSLDGKRLVILPDSREEAVLWQHWAKSLNFEVVTCDFGPSYLIQQELENMVRSVRLAFNFFIKKWIAKPFQWNGRPGAVLIVTLFYQKVFNSESYEDLFFGKLHEDIRQSGHEVLYLADSIDRQNAQSARLMLKNDWPVSIYSLISWREFFGGLWNVLTRRLEFSNCIFDGIDFSSLLMWHARRARYDYNLTAEFFYQSVCIASRKCNFGKMLFAFEGNVYERAAIQGFRKVQPGTHIDAYSHAVVYSLNLKLYLSQLESIQAPEPNRYLVCGGYAKENLLRIRNGSAPVASVCSLRKTTSLISRNETELNEILVVLDGVWSTVNLLNWLYENRSIFDRKVCIRAHPNVCGELLIKQCPAFTENVFYFSNRSLEEDLKRAYCVLYRQSSVGIVALMNLIPVIHLNIDMPLNGDPIEDLKVGKLSVMDRESLRQALSRVPDLYLDLQRNSGENSKVVESYFVEPSAKLKKIFLESNFYESVLKGNVYEKHI